MTVIKMDSQPLLTGEESITPSTSESFASFKLFLLQTGQNFKKGDLRIEQQRLKVKNTSQITLLRLE